MILDTLPLWRRYASLNPRLARGFAFLEQMRPDAPLGRHEIDGDGVYALVQRYTTRPVAEVQLEAHRRYIDIQYLAAGRELIHWAPLTALGAATKAYDAAADFALYATTPDMLPVQLRAGQFAILFPDDAHAPCCTWGDPAEVLKVVVKVEV
jgi:YhcH/YjgK/YiaL family protein